MPMRMASEGNLLLKSGSELETIDAPYSAAACCLFLGGFCYPIKLRSHCALYLVLFSLGQGPQRWGTSERAFLMRSLE
jgi:hypothetical protein